MFKVEYTVTMQLSYTIQELRVIETHISKTLTEFSKLDLSDEAMEYSGILKTHTNEMFRLLQSQQDDIQRLSKDIRLKDAEISKLKTEKVEKIVQKKTDPVSGMFRPNHMVRKNSVYQDNWATHMAMDRKKKERQDLAEGKPRTLKMSDVVSSSLEIQKRKGKFITKSSYPVVSKLLKKIPERIVTETKIPSSRPWLVEDGDAGTRVDRTEKKTYYLSDNISETSKEEGDTILHSLVKSNTEPPVRPTQEDTETPVSPTFSDHSTVSRRGRKKKPILTVSQTVDLIPSNVEERKNYFLELPISMLKKLCKHYACKGHSRKTKKDELVQFMNDKIDFNLK